MSKPINNSRLDGCLNAIVVGLSVVGAALVLVSIFTEQFGLGVTEGFGILQVGLFLMGISALTLAAYLYLRSLRPEDAPDSLQADVSVRLVGSGLIFAYVAGFSDLLQIGTHLQPRFERPFFGPWQFAGVGIGLVVIVAGLYLYHTSKGRRESSLFDFLLPDESES